MGSDRGMTHRLVSLVRFGSIATLAVGAIAAAPAYVAAQCSFDQPTAGTSSTSGTLTTSLVQAFVSCGNPAGNVPNTTTIGGVPSCQPVETFNQQDGSPVNGWRFAQNGSSYGKVTVKRTSSYTNLPGFPPTSRDVYVRVILKRIVKTDGQTLASGNGSVGIIFRVTTEDYIGGDMTVVDFPAQFSVPVVNGTADVRKNVGDLLISIGQPKFTDCTTLEIVSISVRDPLGNVFAVPGVKHL